MSSRLRKRYDSVSLGGRIRSNESLSLIKKRNGGIMRQSVGDEMWPVYEVVIASEISSCERLGVNRIYLPPGGINFVYTLAVSTCFESLHRVLLVITCHRGELDFVQFL